MAVFIIRLGGNLAKVVASAVTPYLCATRWGWRSVCYAYGLGIAAYTLIWGGIARPSPRRRIAGVTGATHEASGDSSAQGRDGTKSATAITTAPTELTDFPLRGVLTKPAMAIVVAQVAHNLCEFNIVSAWAPTYFHEVLHVPLARLGFFTTIPMVVGIASKSVIAAWEGMMLARGTSQLMLRRVATTVGSVIAGGSLLAFSATRSSCAHPLAYIHCCDCDM